MYSEHFIGMSDIDLTQYKINIDKHLKHLSLFEFTSIIRKNCTRDYFSLRSVLTIMTPIKRMIIKKIVEKKC